MNKALEKIIFILVNLILSSSKFLCFWLYNLAVFLNPYHGTFCVFADEWLILTIIIFFLMVFFIWYLKINLFRFIYRAEKFFPSLHKFFDRFLEDSRFRDKTFVGIFVFDLVVLYLSSSFECIDGIRFTHFPPKRGDIIISTFPTLILGGGALICYVAFFLLGKKQKVSC